MSDTDTHTRQPDGAVPEVHRSANEKLTEALRAHPGSTAAELSAVAGIGKSTATKILATWDADGTATRTPGIADGGKRVADRWTLSDTETDSSTGQDTVLVHPTESDQPATEEPPGPQDPVPPDSDTDPHPEAGDIAADHHADAESRGESSQPKTTGTTGKKRRLSSGQLRGQVEDFLREHEGEHFGPGAIGQALGRSSGAVSNALDRLVADGYIVKTNDKPKRFMLKSPTPG